MERMKEAFAVACKKDIQALHVERPELKYNEARTILFGKLEPKDKELYRSVAVAGGWRKW